MNRVMFLFTLCLIVSVPLAFCQPPGDDRPAVAYSLHGVLRIATSSGKVIRSFKTEPPVSTFSISADAETVVFAPAGPEGYGGQLYVLTTKDGKTHQLSHGPYFNKSRNSDEVYSDPDLAPNGREVVFAVHSHSSGDLVEASGPFATIDVHTGKASVLRPTTQLDITGVAFANDPRWAPDGMRILLNFEDGAELLFFDGQPSQSLAANESVRLEPRTWLVRAAVRCLHHGERSKRC